MTRKTMHIILTFALVLIPFSVGMVYGECDCGGSCCCSMQTGIEGGNSQRSPQSLSGPAGCCCNPETPARDFSQGCPLKVSNHSHVAVVRVADNPIGVMVMATSHIELSPALSMDFSQEAWSVYPGPPLPLFLLKQSFLC